jgi:hypothetical protein
MTDLKTGRAFEMASLLNASSTSKVTVGFKTTVATKIALFKEAQSFGFSLSEYLAALLDLRHEEKLVHQINENSEKDSKLIEENKALLWKTESLASEIKCLEKELEYYENHPKIDALWADHDGEIIEFQNAEGIIEKRKIESAKDVFHVIVSSFN